MLESLPLAKSAGQEYYRIKRNKIRQFVYTFLNISINFRGTRNRTQGFMLARQTLFHRGTWALVLIFKGNWYFFFFFLAQFVSQDDVKMNFSNGKRCIHLINKHVGP